MGWQHDPDEGRSNLTDRGYNGLQSGTFRPEHDEPIDNKLVPIGDHRDNEEDDYINGSL